MPLFDCSVVPQPNILSYATPTSLFEIDNHTSGFSTSSISPIPASELQHVSPQEMIFAAPIEHMTIEECYEYRNEGALPPCSLFQNIHIKKSQRSFLSKIYHEKGKTDPRPRMFHCPFCKKTLSIKIYYCNNMSH